MSKQGVILLNLGSPDSTEVSDVRRYLREFLMDGRVLDAPTMFSLMGWPRSSLQLPKLKEAEIRTLIGNMCTPPQAGLLIASFLAINPAFKMQKAAV